MKKILLGLSCLLFASGIFANNRIERNIDKKEFHNMFFYGCTVTIYWHDSSGSYSTSFRYPNINTQSGCFQKMVDILGTLAPAAAYDSDDLQVDELPTLYPEDLIRDKREE